MVVGDILEVKTGHVQNGFDETMYYDEKNKKFILRYKTMRCGFKEEGVQAELILKLAEAVKILKKAYKLD